jgi:hypothetical protein
MTGRARFFALCGIAAAGCYYTVEELQPTGDGGTTKVCTPSCATDELCVEGACIKNCGALTDCEGVCVDTNSTAAHCGDCDQACAGGQLCELGECKDDCSAGSTQCGDGCFDTQTSIEHCGGCDMPCQVDQDCVGGGCVASCESLLTGTPFVDPWGNTWDGTNRPAGAYASANTVCTDIRARLPLATEAQRVKVGSLAALPSVTATDLWTAVWQNTATQYTVDLTDGELAGVPISEMREYRCMCPAPDTPGFSAGDCNGLLGNECFEVPFKGSTIDSRDRALLEKPGAVYECNLLGGRLPSLAELAAAVSLLLPNGSDTPLFAADDMSTSDSSTLKFTDANWGPASGGFTRCDYVDDTLFRCTGWKVQPTPNPVSIPDAFVSERSGRKLDGSDRGAATFTEALDACWDAGGHLATSTELVEMIIEGAAGGTTAAVQTADHATAPNTLGVKWSGTAQRYVYTDNVSSAPKSSLRVYRCIYYPLSSTIQMPTTCQGGCGEVASQGAKQWFDNENRAASGVEDAAAACAALGADLASMRDLLEGFRNGLAKPASPNTLHTLEAVIVFNDAGQGGNGLLALNDVAGPEAPDSDSGFEPVQPGATLPYRCRWTNELR